MALNPKLNVYVVTLNPKDKSSNPTFRDLFKEKYLVANSADNALLNKFFKEFLDKVGKSEFRNDRNAKKVIGVSEYNPDNEKASINIMHERSLIEGLIDGGQYGVMRAYADVNNKSQKTNIGTTKAVLDKYYICLCTPLNSAYGFLFVQSYTEASIQDAVKSFVIELLRCEDNYYNVQIVPYVPQKFVEQFNKEAKVRMFSYRSKTGIPAVMRDNQPISKGMAFDVEIKISPINEELFPGSEETLVAANELAKKQFGDISLNEFGSKTIYIEHPNGYKAHYDVKKELGAIRPTIYLKDEGIKIDPDTGQPDFEQIKEFTLDLLEDVMNEYYDNEEIEEL